MVLVESRCDVGGSLVLHRLWSHLGLHSVLRWVRLRWVVRAWLHLWHLHSRMRLHVHGHGLRRLRLKMGLRVRVRVLVLVRHPMVRSGLGHRPRLEVLHLEMRRGRRGRGRDPGMVVCGCPCHADHVGLDGDLVVGRRHGERHRRDRDGQRMRLGRGRLLHLVSLLSWGRLLLVGDETGENARWGRDGGLGRANRSGMTGDKKRRREQIRRGRGEEEERARLWTTKHCLRQKATAHDRQTEHGAGTAFDSAHRQQTRGRRETTNKYAKGEGEFQLTFGPRGRRCTAPIKGGALGLLHVGLGRGSVSLASGCSRCLMGLGIFLRFRGTSNRSIS